MQRQLNTLALAAGLTMSGAAQATLIDRGGGLIYDDVLNITWLQDASYGAGSSYDDGGITTDGRMSWYNGVAWADNLVYYDSVRNVTYDDWRLPTLTPVYGTSINANFSADGSTDWGINISAPGSAYPGSTASEMAYMYYVNLGLKGLWSPSGSYQPDHGIFGNGTAGQNDVGLIDNLQSYIYWTGRETGLEFPSSTDGAWTFYMDYGFQLAYGGKSPDFVVWAVRSGDVAAAPAPNGVPEPGTVGLLALGLLGLGLTRRRG